MKTKDFAKLVASAADDIQAIDLKILDLAKLSSFTDYFVICSGRSDTQVRAIADSILRKAKEVGRMPIGTEGYAEGHWILIDFGEVVAHIFYQEVRDLYDLEKLWFDAKKISL